MQKLPMKAKVKVLERMISMRITWNRVCKAPITAWHTVGLSKQEDHPPSPTGPPPAKAAFHFLSYIQAALHHAWKFGFIDMKGLITTRDIITRQEVDL